MENIPFCSSRGGWERRRFEEKTIHTICVCSNNTTLWNHIQIIIINVYAFLKATSFSVSFRFCMGKKRNCVDFNRKSLCIYQAKNNCVPKFCLGFPAFV